MRAASASPGAADAARFTRTFVVSILALWACWLALIVVVDPRREFAGSTFPAAQPNSRREKLTFLAERQREAPVEVLVLGSSRVFALHPDRFTAAKLGRGFNLAVHQGGIRDALALYRLARERGVHPSLVLLGVDETWLGTSFEEATSLETNYELQSALAEGERPSRWRYRFRTFERMMTPAYAFDAMRAVRAVLSGVKPRGRTEADGTTWEPALEEALSRGDADVPRIVRRSLGFFLPKLSGYDGPDTARVRALRSLLAELRRDSVAIRAFLPPYHPILLEAAAQRPRAQQGLELARRHVRRTFEDAGVPLADFTDSRAFGADPGNWYDAAHLGARNGERLVRALVAGGL